MAMIPSGRWNLVASPKPAMIDPARYRDDDNDTQRTHDQPVHSRVRQRFRHAVQGFDGVVLERLEGIKSTDAKKHTHAASALERIRGAK